jgi:urease accessory protein
MRDTGSFLAALQLADSALPMGRFVHSYGLEAWVSADERIAAELVELIETALLEAIGPLDGAAVAHAHRAVSLDDLIQLDRLLTAHKLTPSARIASCSCGRQLARLAPRLITDTLVDEFCTRVRSEMSDGNLAIVEGVVGRGLGLSAEETVLIELRGVAVAFLSAAIRLGRFSPLHAQVALRRLGPVIAQAAEEALALPRDRLRSTGPELEIYALSHRRADARLFTT